MKSIENIHPWLRVYSGSVENYISPDYYSKLLKEYNFSGRLDLDYFSSFLKGNFHRKVGNVLELGVGFGRATDVFIDSLDNFKRLDLVDLSEDMFQLVKNKYKRNKKIFIYKSDNLEYIKKTKNKYDFIYSIWSFSHSVHYNLIDKNKKEGYVESIISKFIQNNMNSGAGFFLIHSDSLSEEQKILMRQWRKFFPEFKSKTKQSPSKLILDKVFSSLDEKGDIVDLTVSHLEGDPIIYDSMENTLEIFMNFHMETEFNKHKNVQKILYELKEDIKKYKKADGKYYIRPGCFIYTFKKK